MSKGKWVFHSGDPELIGKDLKQVTKAFRDPAQLDCYLVDFRGIKTVIQKREIEIPTGRLRNGREKIWEYALFRNDNKHFNQ